MPLSSQSGQAFLKQMTTGQNLDNQPGTNLPPVNGADSASMQLDKEQIQNTASSIQNGVADNGTPSNGHQEREVRDTIQAHQYQNMSSKFAASSQQAPSTMSN